MNLDDSHILSVINPAKQGNWFRLFLSPWIVLNLFNMSLSGPAFGALVKHFNLMNIFRIIKMCATSQSPLLLSSSKRSTGNYHFFNYFKFPV